MNSDRLYPAARVLLAKKTTQGEGMVTTPTPHAAVRAAHSHKARPCTGTGLSRSGGGKVERQAASARREEEKQGR